MHKSLGSVEGYFEFTSGNWQLVFKQSYNLSAYSFEKYTEGNVVVWGFKNTCWVFSLS